MRTPPASPTSAEVLMAVRRFWSPGAERAVYLPVGFGAHHWRIEGGEDAALFATLDLPSPTRCADSFEAAYRAAHALAEEGPPGVLAPRPAQEARLTVPLEGGLLSVTPWQEGRTPTEQEARGEEHLERLQELLQGLHAASAPGALRPWAARVGPELTARLAAATAEPWRSGPWGEAARELLRSGQDRIAAWERRYRELRALEETRAAERVPTHGEPHWANQMLLATGELLLVDWETLAAAPRERDLAALPPQVQRAESADPAMLELFALEWTLSEVEEYQRWFRGPHLGTEDDEIALEGLREELS